MPGMILHVGATVLCSHGGQAQPTVPNPRVTVGGQPIVCQPPPWVVAGCPFIAGIVPLPCVTGQFITAAMRVTAGGQPVLLSTSQSICVPSPLPLVIVTTQAKVSAQ